MIRDDMRFHDCVFQLGLTVVEVYFDWAGPCHAMTRCIKNIKMEVGGGGCRSSGVGTS